MSKNLIGKKFSDEMAMNLSIEEAKKGQAWVSPNPPVGCVILDKNHCFLSSGYHSAYGQDHAEIEAFKKIKNKKHLEGSYVFVTLEPCAHQGQTPPCVDTLIQYDLAQVFYGQKDPDSRTNGLGIKKLKTKGIRVKEYSHFKNSIKELYEIFNYNKIHQTAFVSLKIATSLDGKIGLSDGSSQWITSPASRDYVSDLRAHHQAVLIGVKTFLEDNPRLNSRKKPFHSIKNKVIILDPQGLSLNLIKKSRLAQVRPLSHIFVVTKQEPQNKIKTASKVISSVWDPNNNQFDLKKLKSVLYNEEGISSILVEGGAYTFSSFLEKNEMQILYQFMSPSILGGKLGVSWSESLKTQDLTLKKQGKRQDFFPIDQDFFLKYSFLENA